MCDVIAPDGVFARVPGTQSAVLKYTLKSDGVSHLGPRVVPNGATRLEFRISVRGVLNLHSSTKNQ